MNIKPILVKIYAFWQYPVYHKNKREYQPEYERIEGHYNSVLWSIQWKLIIPAI